MDLVHKMRTIDGLLEVHEDKVSITPKGVIGFLRKGLKGTKTIQFLSISAIQFKKSGITGGYLQFTVSGANESTRGRSAAAKDENSFLFWGKNDQALEIKEYIEKRIQELHNPQATSSSPSVSDELQKLAELKEQGVLSDEEFQTAKRRLLDAT